MMVAIALILMATVICQAVIYTSADAAIDSRETAQCDEPLSLSAAQREALRFDAEGAAEQIDAHGFSVIGELSLRGNGHWCGKARKFDRRYEVRIDRSGNFYREPLGN